MKDLYVEYTFAERTSDNTGPFIMDTKKVKRVGPFEEPFAEKRAADIMGDANTVPGTTRIVRKQTKSSDEVIGEVAEVLAQADGDFIQQIANQVLMREVDYEGDSMFAQYELEKEF